MGETEHIDPREKEIKMQGEGAHSEPMHCPEKHRATM